MTQIRTRSAVSISPASAFYRFTLTLPCHERTDRTTAGLQRLTHALSTAKLWTHARPFVDREEGHLHQRGVLEFAVQASGEDTLIITGRLGGNSVAMGRDGLIDRRLRDVMEEWVEEACEALSPHSGPAYWRSSLTLTPATRQGATVCSLYLPLQDVPPGAAPKTGPAYRPLTREQALTPLAVVLPLTAGHLAALTSGRTLALGTPTDARGEDAGTSVPLTPLFPVPDASMIGAYLSRWNPQNSTNPELSLNIPGELTSLAGEVPPALTSGRLTLSAAGLEVQVQFTPGRPQVSARLPVLAARTVRCPWTLLRPFLEPDASSVSVLETDASSGHAQQGNLK